jgi:2-alkyl-3-oxoalkanoate reductase
MVRKALVTGGGGFVGLAIVERLAAEGIETTVVGRHRYPAAEALGAHCLVGDIRDRLFLERAAADHDTVFHVAAKAGIWGSREAYFSVNVAGTENVIEACRRNGVRTLVHTSTPSVVFDGRSIEGGDERLPYSRKPLCHYAASKILAEKKDTGSQFIAALKQRPTPPSGVGPERHPDHPPASGTGAKRDLANCRRRDQPG